MPEPNISISPPDAKLANILRKLWPNREHESNAFMGLLCHLGWHRWSTVDVERIIPERVVRFCRWCPGVEIDGVIYRD
jgi:hypothetical protein